MITNNHTLENCQKKTFVVEIKHKTLSSFRRYAFISSDYIFFEKHVISTTKVFFRQYESMVICDHHLHYVSQNSANHNTE